MATPFDFSALQEAQGQDRLAAIRSNQNTARIDLDAQEHARQTGAPDPGRTAVPSLDGTPVSYSPPASYSPPPSVDTNQLPVTGNTILPTASSDGTIYEDQYGWSTDDGLGGAPSAPGTASDDVSTLRPASWRNVTFYVRREATQPGRMTARHDYPFRDGCSVEDLGRLGKLYTIEGFMVGDNMPSLYAQIVQALDAPGPGTLVHPMLGQLTVAALPSEVSTDWDARRVISLRLYFSETLAPAQNRGLTLQPDTSTSAQDDLDDAADDADDASSDGWLDAIGDGLHDLGSAASSVFHSAQAAYADVQQAVQPYVQTATAIAGDATRAVNAVNGIAGSFGRYSGGSRLGALPVTGQIGGALLTASQAKAAVTTTLGRASTIRQTVTDATGRLAYLGSSL